MPDSKLHIVLHQPEIPGNAGSIGRTCLALNAELILIQPYGFSLDEKSVRRAGLDYWKHVHLSEFSSWSDFMETRKPSTEQIFLMETKATKSIYQAQFSSNCYLVFGAETKGLPPSLIDQYPHQTFELPMFSSQIRSINLSNAATAAAYIAFGKINHFI